MPSPSQRDKHFNVESFLKQMAPAEVLDFFGVEIPVPTDAPLSYTLKAQQIAESDAQDQQNVLELLSDVLGQEKADEIEEVNPGIRAIGALLLWAFQNASGDAISFPDAYEKYLEQEKDNREKAAAEAGGESGEDSESEEGKAQVVPNRSERRAAAQSGRKSASTSR